MRSRLAGARIRPLARHTRDARAALAGFRSLPAPPSPMRWPGLHPVRMRQIHCSFHSRADSHAASACSPVAGWASQHADRALAAVPPVLCGFEMLALAVSCRRASRHGRSVLRLHLYGAEGNRSSACTSHVQYNTRVGRRGRDNARLRPLNKCVRDAKAAQSASARDKARLSPGKQTAPQAQPRPLTAIPCTLPRTSVPFLLQLLVMRREHLPS